MIAGLFARLQVGEITPEELAKEIPDKIRLVGNLLQAGTENTKEIIDAIEKILAGEHG
jgi:hypothetical protein